MFVRTSVPATNLGVHFKHGRENSLVWVTTPDHGQPVAGAQVAVSDCDEKPLWSGRTDAQGLARISPAPDVRAATVFDRTLFRAGETVSMKHFVRTETSAGLANLPADALPARMRIVHEGTGQEFVQPLQRNGARNAASSWRNPPAALPVEVQLNHFSGRPMALTNARASALLKNRSVRFDGHDEFSFEPPREPGVPGKNQGKRKTATPNRQHATAKSSPINCRSPATRTVPHACTRQTLPKVRRPAGPGHQHAQAHGQRLLCTRQPHRRVAREEALRAGRDRAPAGAHAVPRGDRAGRGGARRHH